MRFKVLADKPTEIYDPESGELIGVVDREKVRVKVVEVQEKLAICVEIVGLFGSYVRQEQRLESDLDILVEHDRIPRINLIGLVELEDYLSQILGVKVDLAIKTNLKKRIGRRILQEVIPI